MGSSSWGTDLTSAAGSHRRESNNFHNHDFLPSISNCNEMHPVTSPTPSLRIIRILSFNHRLNMWRQNFLWRIKRRNWWFGAIRWVLTPSLGKPRLSSLKNEPFSQKMYLKIPLSTRGLKVSNSKQGCFGSTRKCRSPLRKRKKTKYDRLFQLTSWSRLSIFFSTISILDYLCYYFILNCSIWNHLLPVLWKFVHFLLKPESLIDCSSFFKSTIVLTNLFGIRKQKLKLRIIMIFFDVVLRVGRTRGRAWYASQSRRAIAGASWRGGSAGERSRTTRWRAQLGRGPCSCRWASDSRACDDEHKSPFNQRNVVTSVESRREAGGNWTLLDYYVPGEVAKRNVMEDVRARCCGGR